MSKRDKGRSGTTYHVVWRAPPNHFAKETFRIIKVGNHRVILACPKSELHAGHCDLAEKIEAVLHAKEEKQT
jgi:hypothetical protein